jgi:hypothetical protein
VALARWVQVVRRFESVQARAPIPTDVRNGAHATSRIDSYCARAKSDTIIEEAEALACECAEQIGQLDEHGWWDDVCISSQ